MPKVRVHKIVLKIVDFEGSDDAEVSAAVSDHRYFPGNVMSHVAADTEWDGDDHPLNKPMTAEQFDAWLTENSGRVVS